MANGSLRICLDPGHSINYNRGVIPGYFESNMNWKLANFLKEELLKYKNTEVFITKSRLDSNPDLESRGRYAIQNNCEVFYSIHSNAASAAACGVSVFRSVKRPDSVKLGQLLGQKDVDIMRKDTGITYLRQNGNSTRLYPDTTNTDYYGVIRASVRSDIVKYSYIIEHGFHTNPTECTWLMDDNHIRELAKGEADVLASYFSLQLKEAPTPAPSEKIEVGDIIDFAGGGVYSSANATTPSYSIEAGKYKVTQIYMLGKSKHPYSINSADGERIYGWVDEDKCSKNGVKPTPTPPPVPQPVTCPYPEPTRQLNKGKEGEDVKWVQWYLCEDGYNVSIDGKFGSDTDKKVRQFQGDQGIKVDGWVGDDTKARLKNPQAKKTNPYKEPTSDIRKGAKGEGVKWTQWELVEAGYNIAIDGSFGSATDNAVRDFQKKSGLKVDGWVGKDTRAKLKAN